MISLTLQDRLAGMQSFSKDAQVLRSFLGLCDRLEHNWHIIEAFCSQMPKTMVHGDLSLENFRTRINGNASELLIIDWEKAGFGVPAVDLSLVDHEVYWAVVSSHWPHLDQGKIAQLQRFGRIFRTLVHDIHRKPARKIKSFGRRLAKELEAVGFV